MSFITALSPHARWKQNGVTIAGGHGQGGAANQLSYPWGIYVEDDRTVLIADWGNNRIVEWKQGATIGRVVAGGNGSGCGMNQLSQPTDVTVDKETNSLIICSSTNRRVMRWSRRSEIIIGEKVVNDVYCDGLTMDDEGNLYVTDVVGEVRRYRMGQAKGTVVAGGNGRGNNLDQLKAPTNVFVDGEYSVYISEWGNDRVIKWAQGAKEGAIVAGGRGKGKDLTQLSMPNKVFVDALGTVYVADMGNHRVMRWSKGANKGEVIAGSAVKGAQAHQLDNPTGVAFDPHGNLYVADCHNHRVQRFSLETS